MPTRLCLLRLRSIMGAAGTILAVLLVSTACCARTSLAGIGEESLGPQQSQPQGDANLQPAHKRPSTNRKVIKDPAEYNAYITALNTPDPERRASGMEDFVIHYPQSVVKTDALEQALSAYEKIGNAAKVEDTANQLLQLDPDNLRALAIITFLKRNHATQAVGLTGAVDLANEVSQLGQKGLAALPNWEEPEAPHVDVVTLRNEMTAIFAGAAGFGALQNRDYASARKFYEKAVHLDPNNMQDVFQLAVADLQMNPIDPKGFWYCGKAVHIAQRQKKAEVEAVVSAYCKAVLYAHTGRSEGWDRLVIDTAKDTAPPPNFAESLPISARYLTTQETVDAQSALSNLSGRPAQPSAPEQGDPISRLLAPVGGGSGIGAGSGPREKTVVADVTMSAACKTSDNDVCYSVGNGVLAPTALSSPEPVYPQSGSLAKIEGIERLQLIVGIDGNPHDIRVIKSLSPEFDEKAIAAVKQWKFKPATKDGKPVAAYIMIEINFHLGSETSRH